MPAIFLAAAAVATAISGVLLIEASGIAAPGAALILGVEAWQLALRAGLYISFFPAVFLGMFAGDVMERCGRRLSFCIALGLLFFAVSLADSLIDSWMDNLSAVNLGLPVAAAFSALSAAITSAACGPITWALLRRRGQPAVGA